MTKLSAIRGFGASGGGGSDGKYTGVSLVTDTYSTNMTDAGYNYKITNLDAYAQAIRIRGMDTSTKAYFGHQCMMLNSSTPGSGDAAHTFTLFSANQNTGAITREGVINVYQTSQGSDYSTFSRCSDEWTGRYTYMGNCPRSGSNSHQYGWDSVLIYNTSSSTSNHTVTSSYYPNGNGTKYMYVAPYEHRVGGAVYHTTAAYASSNSKAVVCQWNYAYSSSSVNSQSNQSAPFSTSDTSTNYEVSIFWQWDPNYTQPYYSDYHSFSEGLYAKTRSGNSWSNIDSSAPLSDSIWGFHLSSGKVLMNYSGELKLIDTSGNLSAVSDGNTTIGIARMGSYKNSRFCWNIGQDEWLQHMPDGKFIKFKLDPQTGIQTNSNVLQVDEFMFPSFDTYYEYKTGLFSNTSLTSTNYSSQSYTFGNENSNGNGYGQKKMMFIGGHDSLDRLYVKTYDFTPLIDQLQYSS